MRYFSTKITKRIYIKRVILAGCLFLLILMVNTRTNSVAKFEVASLRLRVLCITLKKPKKTYIKINGVPLIREIGIVKY